MNTNINLIDTHAHIYSEDLISQIEDIRSRWMENNVTKIFMPNIDSTSIKSMLELETKYPECFAMMGLHPCSVKDNYKQELKIVSDWFEKRDFCAVGEIGVDLYWDQTFKEEQIEAFRFQIAIAKVKSIPFVIHSRDSLDLTIDIVEELQDGNLTGIFHCFSGTVEQAQKIIDLGFAVGIGGVVTFKNSGLDKVVKDIPLESIVLETDSPYLAPSPFRGKKNEPSYLFQICDKVATVKDISFDEVASKTTENAEKIFHKTPKSVDL